ncbi:MAG: PQQ-like beta-propeller repeat protein, partial [Planctomycetes bacterium]|nr:PQQ-like beta-propeller repeat protein [Planctomycetota bacterium]
CVLTFALANTSQAEDWPRWRGVRGDGTWKAPKLPEKWPAEGLKEVWKQPIGGGYAGITVADGRVYTLDLAEPIVTRKDDQPDGTERIRCFDLKTGNPLWSHPYPVKYGGLGGYNNGPRSAPTVHDGKLYTLGAVGHFFCLDAASGKILWSKDMVKEFKARVPEWGFAAAPVIDGDRVLVHTGAEPNGSLIAFDRVSGKEVWRSLSDPAGYCTPIVIHPKSGRQIVLWTPLNIRGLDAETGKLLWTVPYKVTYGVSIATPIFQENLVYVTGYWQGSKTIRLGEQPTDFELIREETKEQRGLMAQPLYRDGHVYTMDKQFGLTCFELKTGKKLWDDDNKMTPKARNPHASFVWIDDGDRILSLNAEGELILARLNPKGYEEQSRTRIIEGRVWGHPAFADRYVIARNDGGERFGKGPYQIVCVKLTKD